MNAVVLHPGLMILIGAVLLMAGRKLFWLFVGVAGFLVGIDLAHRFFSGPEMTRLIIALIVGIAGAFLAIIFYKAAVAIAGFFMGGYLGVQLVKYLALSIPQSMSWIPYVIGGIVGAVLILLLLDWALILLSSLAGASLIVNALPQFNAGIVFIVLVVIGILVQGGFLLRSHPSASA